MADEPTRTSAEARTSSQAGGDDFTHGRFAPGTLLAGRYRVVSRLGAGGMGEVYRADDLTLGQSVALKFLPVGVERDQEKLERLIAEIRTARQVAHPNVCRVYDVGEIPSAYAGQATRFLTMEYVDGEDLQSLLRRIGRLPEDKALDIARQLCAGLAAIHDRGVLHRDLKPANVMLDGRGRVRLTDFGLATPSSGGRPGREVAADIAGTPAYMAPEQFAAGTLTPATDLYALGLVLFELFTGERVQGGKDVDAIRTAQSTIAQTLSTSASGAKLDPLVQRVIARCLEHDPVRRPQSAVIVAAALPGGDPLAAAMAAGETPSPQMVAAAGDDGGLSFRVAVPLLAAIVAGVLLLGWAGAPVANTRLVPVPLSSEVLAAKAREVLTRLGHGTEVADSAHGFNLMQTADYQRWLDAQEGGLRWSQRPQVRPSLVTFWYRTSPRSLMPRRDTGPVTADDPGLTVPGMTALVLDPEGRLVAFDAVPQPWNAPVSANEPDARAIFEVAGLDAQNFVEAEPEWVGASPGDVRRAWVGPGATDAGGELRLEAAWLGGRLVFARLIAPWTRREERASSPGTWVVLLGQAVGNILVFGTVAAALLIARLHVRRRRADLRGATRFAVAMGVISSLSLLIGLKRWPPPNVGLMALMGWPVLQGWLAWAFYIAVEPAVRRDWPQMLIAWSRLLEGRWRDPLVGRSLLIGSALGIVTSLVAVGWERLMGAGQSPLVRLTVRQVLLGQLDATEAALFLVFGLALLLVLLRRWLGTEGRALAALLSVLVSFAALLNYAGIVVVAVMVGSPLVVATRWGLLAGVTMVVVSAVSRPDLFVLPPWATAVVVLTLVGQLGPALFGFYTATRGRASATWLEG